MGDASATIKALALLVRAAYLDGAPTEEQADAFKEASHLARVEVDKLLAEIKRLRAALEPTAENIERLWQAWEAEYSGVDAAAARVLAAIRERAGIETQTKDGK